jgi:alkylated DNA repair dioxygenase AlkB
MRILLARGGWVDHEPQWIARDEADRLLAAVREELTWEQREVILFGRAVVQPRLIAWGGSVAYRYSGRTLEPRRFTPTLARLVERTRQIAGVPFNHVLVNRYRNGDDCMGFHADDEPELGEDPVVVTVTLGTARRFVLLPRSRRDGERLSLDLGHGALFVMGGTCQRHYRHGVPRQPTIRTERISLTFRWLLREPPPIPSG